MTDIQFLIYIHSLTMAWLYVNTDLQFPIYLIKKEREREWGGACLSTKLLQSMHTYTVEVRITDSGL